MDTKICNCGSVTKGDIFEAVKNGSTTIALVGLNTGGGTYCGTCEDKIAEVIEEAKASLV